MARRVPKAIISEEALVMMLASAAEVYDKETYGFILGRRRKKDFYIQYAVSHQSAYRYSYGVQVTKKREQRLIQTINFFKGYRYIGEFHSHPDSYCKLSKHDIKDMKESGPGISVIISIEPAEKQTRWEYDKKDKCIKGTIDDDTYIMLKAYKCDEDSERILKLRLECPFLEKLNKRLKKEYPELFTGKRKKNRKKLNRSTRKTKRQS